MQSFNSALLQFLQGVGFSNAAKTFQSLFTFNGTATRAITVPDASGTLALTSDLPPAATATLSATGFGLTPQGCRLSPAAVAAPGTNVVQYDALIILGQAEIDTADPGGVLELRLNGVAVAAFDASIVGQTLANDPPGPLLVAAGDVLTVAATGGTSTANGKINFSLAPIP